VARRLIPQPYAYPALPHVRRHGPCGWSDYKKYRPWLRDEFTFRCVYCLDREVWRDMREPMHIDHFQPQALRGDLKCEYTNLLYLCPACNSQKSNIILPDPCAVALADCLRVHDDGRIEARNSEGQALIDVLALDDPRTVERRRRMMGMLRTLAEANWLEFVQWMRFPEDLPDLRAPPMPPHNLKLEGIEQSSYERKRRGELPEVY
jgi:hypothetical protein